MAPAGHALYALGALAFLAFTLPQLTRPLVYDDVNFALAARAVAETGLPFGNQGWLSDRYDYSQREQWALWHPPLYVYLLGLFAKVFGPTEWSLRLPGVLGGLVGGWLTLLLAAEVVRGSPGFRRLVGGVAAALAMVTPAYVQSGLILDIDFPVLMPLTLLFLLLYLRFEATTRWPWLIPLLALMFWTKMTNPLPVMGAVVAWQVLRGQFRRAALHGAGIGLGGAALFGATWVAIGGALGFPLDMPFGVNAVQWQHSGEVGSRAFESVHAFIDGLRSTGAWFGPGLLTVGLAGAAIRAAQLATTRRVAKVDLLLGLAVVLLLGYVNKSAGWFPKYQVVLIPLLLAAGAPLVARALRRFSHPTLVVGGAIAAASALVVLRMVRDDWAYSRQYTIGEEPAAYLLGIVLVGSVAGGTFLALRRHPREAGLAFMVAFAGLSLGWSTAVDWAQLRAPYSTTYWYGTTGAPEAAAWVDANVPPGSMYVASKEVAWLAENQRFVDMETLSYHLDALGTFTGEWEGERIDAIVVWVREPFLSYLFDRDLPQFGYQATQQFGDFRVYERESGS